MVVVYPGRSGGRSARGHGHGRRHAHHSHTRASAFGGEADRAVCQPHRLSAHGVAALGLHLKNGLVEPRPLLPVLATAVPASVVTSFFALDPAPLVGRLYGGFLVAVALFGLVSGVAANLKKKG